MTSLEYTREEKVPLGTVANILYYHQARTWDSPLSFGVQAFIEYNGLVINDRKQADLIRVTEITGLDDSEVRDSREPKPGASGENAYASFYGGRNIVINGFIEAGNLGALENLRSYLKAAFAPLNESPLKFRWFDIYDSFSDPNTILEYNSNASLNNIPSGNYTSLFGNLSNLKVENGALLWNNPSKVYFVRTSDKRTFGDFQTTLRIAYGKSDNSEIGFLLCAKNEENYLTAVYQEEEGFFPSLNIYTCEEGKITQRAKYILTSAQKPVQSQVFWLKGKKEGNYVSLEMYNELPEQLSIPVCFVSYNLENTGEELFGEGILTQVGIAGEQSNSQWNFYDFKVESIYPGDIVFNAKKIGQLSIKDVQNSLTKFKRSFQIPMRTSEFRAVSSAEISKFTYPTSEFSTPTKSRSYPRTYPLSYKILSNTKLVANTNFISIKNSGNTYIDPILYLYGPSEIFIIENFTNGNILEFFGKIAENDYIIFNCKEETLENSIGINYLEFLVPTTEWMKLNPGWNDIYVQGSGFVTNKTKFYIKTKLGWM